MARPSVVFNAKPAADRFRADIDAALGLPRPNILGPGVHGPQGQTTTYAFLLKHPARNQWAFPDEPIVRGKRGQVPVPGGASQQDIDSDPTWDGAVVVAFRAEELE